ncbi:NAD kinase [Methanobrevibacter filiformis]|uniref:NAD kinase n=2 Tax=Methanobrevibacter filiformis TaxID=55758 RepID=A0A166F5U9_9EURY|nr:NAD kinase [Methanobrevibacter filiformis]
MNKKDIEICKKISYKIIEDVENEIKLHINEDDAGKIIEIGADGTPTKLIDKYAEDKVIKNLKNCDFNNYLISEEIGQLIIGNGTAKSIDIEKNIENKKKINTINQDNKTNKDNNDEAKFIFIIDPLDGTNNAIKGIPVYGISIAISKIRENKIPTLEDIEIAVIKDLYCGDLYEAVKGKGTYLNSEKISPNIETNLSKVSLGGYIKPQGNSMELLSKIRRMRLLGSVAIESSYISTGKYDVYVDIRGSRTIDIAGSKLIIEESGSIITDIQGNKLKNNVTSKNTTQIIASTNKELHEQVTSYFNSNNEKTDDLSEECWNKNPVKSVGVVSRLDKEESILIAGEIIQRLSKNGIDVQINSKLAEKLEEYKEEDKIKIAIGKIAKTNEVLYDKIKNFKITTNFQKLARPISEFEIDVLITFGGDGTILMAQNRLKEPVPIFGINMGTVGFLTEVDIEDIDKKLNKLLKNEFYTEKRSQVKVSYSDQLFSALNEVVIMTEKPAKMLHFEVEVDGEVIEEFRADGLILSTPSGSTAYSMSAGGPIVDPHVEAFIIIPICPYKLGIRPFVVSDNSEIKIRLLRKGKKAILVMDGQINKEIRDLDEVKFKKSERPVYFIRTEKKEFYQKVKEKLSEGGIR